jgi:hypothetical protein
MENLDNENSEIATALQMALSLCIAEKHTDLSQVIFRWAIPIVYSITGNKQVGQTQQNNSSCV